MSEERIANDFSDEIGEISVEIFGRDDRKARRRVHYLCCEVRPEHRLRGLFKVGHKICMLKSVLRADLRRRAEGRTAAETEATA